MVALSSFLILAIVASTGLSIPVQMETYLARGDAFIQELQALDFKLASVKPGDPLVDDATSVDFI